MAPDWDKDAIEAELAHVGADQVRRAYHRALYWDERVKMAEWWATLPGWKVLGVEASPITGPEGNREFLLGAVKE